MAVDLEGVHRQLSAIFGVLVDIREQGKVVKPETKSHSRRQIAFEELSSYIGERLLTKGGADRELGKELLRCLHVLGPQFASKAWEKPK